MSLRVEREEKDTDDRVTADKSSTCHPENDNWTWQRGNLKNSSIRIVEAEARLKCVK